MCDSMLGCQGCSEGRPYDGGATTSDTKTWWLGRPRAFGGRGGADQVAPGHLGAEQARLAPERGERNHGDLVAPAQRLARFCGDHGARRSDAR